MHVELAVPAQHPVVTIVDDTGNIINPVDAATVTALDAIVTGHTTAIAALAPWIVDLDAFQTHGNTGWNTPSPIAGVIHSGYNLSAGNQNDELFWDTVLSAGTWAIGLMHATGTNRGIYTILIDDVSVGTVDGYAGVTALNTVSNVTGIVVATTGVKRVKLRMATKNASSSSFFGLLQHTQLRRTA